MALSVLVLVSLLLTSTEAASHTAPEVACDPAPTAHRFGYYRFDTRPSRTLASWCPGATAPLPVPSPTPTPTSTPTPETGQPPNVIEFLDADRTLQEFDQANRPDTGATADDAVEADMKERGSRKPERPIEDPDQSSPQDPRDTGALSGATQNSATQNSAGEVGATQNSANQNSSGEVGAAARDEPDEPADAAQTSAAQGSNQPDTDPDPATPDTDTDPDTDPAAPDTEPANQDTDPANQDTAAPDTDADTGPANQDTAAPGPVATNPASESEGAVAVTEEDAAAQGSLTPTSRPTVNQLAAWLRATTGREFTSPPTVTFEAAQEISQESIETAISVDAWNIWVTLGLIDPQHSRRVAALAWRETGKGTCCPVRVVVSDNPLRTATVTVHELAHALDWGRIQPEPTTSMLSPVLAIAEGNAQRLSRQWANHAGASEIDIDQATAVFEDNQDERLPEPVRRMLEYPYREGLAFAEAIAAHGGEEAILAAFERPPNSVEVLNPDRWLAGEQWDQVAPPVDLLDAQPSGGGQLGAFILSLMIEPAVGAVEARALADTWVGDSYIIAATIEQTCVAVRIVVRDEASASAFEQALRSTNGFAHATGHTVNFTRCT